MSDLKQGDNVSVSGMSDEDASYKNYVRTFVTKYKGLFYCSQENEDLDGLVAWNFAVKIPEPKTIPFTAESFPKGMVWIRELCWDVDKGLRSLITTINRTSVHYDVHTNMDFDDMIILAEISLDGGKTWQVAGIEEGV